jgi:MFS family permease
MAELIGLAGPLMDGMSRRTGGFRLGRTASFTMLVLANVLLMASTSAPSPIYPLYQQRWGFSVTTLTVIFAVYVAGLVAALLTVGSLSDYVGRRPVLVISMLMAAAGTAIFWVADGVFWLVLGRVVQGIATGTATGALTAGLVDFSPEGRLHVGPTMTAAATAFGLAVGGGLTGALAAASPRPDAMIFPVLTVAFVVLAAAIFALPETAMRRAVTRAALLPRARVPRETRQGFMAAVPAIVAEWSVTGLFLALAPSLVRDVLHVQFGAIGGLCITVLFIANCAGGLSAAQIPAQQATILGAILMAIGTAGLATALVFASASFFTGAAIIAGLGVGLTFNGTMRSISGTTSAASRSQVFSVVFVVSYAALGLPSLAAGLAAQSWGLKSTTYAYLAFIAALSLIAAMHAARRLTLQPAAEPRDTAARGMSARTRMRTTSTAPEEFRCKP